MLECCLKGIRTPVASVRGSHDWAGLHYSSVIALVTWAMELLKVCQPLSALQRDGAKRKKEKIPRGRERGNYGVLFNPGRARAFLCDYRASP